MNKNLFTVDYSMSAEKRIELAEKHIWMVHLHEGVIDECDYDYESQHSMHMYGEQQYTWKLFEFPKGISEKMALYRMRTKHWTPANPAHMLAFATQCCDTSKLYYIIGLGGRLQTVLGSQFGGMGIGCVFFFQHLPQHEWTHDGGPKNLFLGVREVPIR